jgi:Carboxypeptidase regulatory-like domain
MTRQSLMERCVRRTALALFFSFSAIAAHGQMFTGTVSDAANGSVLQSMVVAAYTTSGVPQTNTTTDAAGHYILPVPSGQYRVLAYDPIGTYATEFTNDASSFEESPLTAVQTDQVVTMNFALRRGVTVSGSVGTSLGFPGGLTVAAYNLTGTRRGFTPTNAVGIYSLVLPPGTYKLVAYDDAGTFAPAFFRGQASFTDADPVTVNVGQSVPSIDFFLNLGSRISGIVTDAGGVPLANVSVLAYSSDGKYFTFVFTGSDGHFSITLPHGSYRFVAIDDAFTFAAGFTSGATSFESSPVITVSEGQSRSDLVFRLECGGLITGRVLDPSGAGIVGITVAAFNTDGTMRTFVTTDASGKYVLLLPPGAFRISALDPSLVYATQFYPQQKSFAGSVAIAAAIGQSSTLTPFTLSRGGRVSGTVVDQNTHAAIGALVIQAYDSSGFQVGSTTTSADGTFKMVLPGGFYRLVAADPKLLYAPGYVGGAASFDGENLIAVNVDGVTTANFSLSRGTLVIGSVVDESHQPIGGVEVSALDSAQNRVATVTTARDGSFRISLIPGSYRFLADDPAGRYITSYAGGTTFASAAMVSIDATGAPSQTISMPDASRRRSVRR